MGRVRAALIGDGALAPAADPARARPQSGPGAVRRVSGLAQMVAAARSLVQLTKVHAAMGRAGTSVAVHATPVCSTAIGTRSEELRVSGSRWMVAGSPPGRHRSLGTRPPRGDHTQGRD